MIQDNLQHTSSQNLEQVSIKSSVKNTLFFFLSDEEMGIARKKITQLKEIIKDSDAEIKSTVLDALYKEFNKEEVEKIVTYKTIIQSIVTIEKELNDTQLSTTQKQSLEKKLESLEAINKNIQKTRNFNKNLKRFEELEAEIQEQVLAKYIKEIEELEKEIREFYVLCFRQNLESVASLVRRGIVRIGDYSTLRVDETFLNLLKKYAFASAKEQKIFLLEMEKRLNELPTFIEVKMVQVLSISSSYKRFSTQSNYNSRISSSPVFTLISF